MSQLWATNPDAVLFVNIIRISIKAPCEVEIIVENSVQRVSPAAARHYALKILSSADEAEKRNNPNENPYELGK